MTPKKMPPKKLAHEPWDGQNRRKPRAVNWWPTRIGVLLVIAGIGIHLILRERLDMVPLALIILGGAMIDKDAVKAASKMFSIRRGGDTEERSTWSHGE